MSLYYEAAGLLSSSSDATGSLASRVYGNKSLKSKPAHVFALISEAIKWSSILSQVIEKAEVLRLEKKLNPILAILLTHDLLLAKSGVAAPKDHVLRLAIERHKARLSADFTKQRLKAGFATVQDWRIAVEEGLLHDGLQPDSSKARHPRWIRINTIRTTLDDELKDVFESYEYPVSLPELFGSGTRRLTLDEHIPNLVAIPQINDISSSQAYRQGKIIFQDKASCFSAYLLNPQPEDGDIIDACAAPGNKTTHLAALLAETRAGRENLVLGKQKLLACERDKTRAVTLQKMVNIAGAEVDCLLGQDFLRLDANQARWHNVGALLLDPSCSGSGIVGRDDESDTMPIMTLPRPPWEVQDEDVKAPRGKKRKRKSMDVPKPTPSGRAIKETEDTGLLTIDSGADESEQADDKTKSNDRLTSLSAFQLKIIKHSFKFPSAKKVVYSTCSIHVEENERVVLRALASPVAIERGWRILRRSEQVNGMQKWHVRGDRASTCRLAEEDVESGGHEDAKKRRWTAKEAQEIADACLRCEKGTEQGTMGFFVAGFVRDRVNEGGISNQHAPALQADDGNEDEGSADEFGGFSDSE